MKIIINKNKIKITLALKNNTNKTFKISKLVKLNNKFLKFNKKKIKNKKNKI